MKRKDRMKDRDRMKVERERAGSTLITPGPHCEWAVHPARERGMEKERDEMRTEREREREFIYPPLFDACGVPL